MNYAGAPRERNGKAGGAGGGGEAGAGFRPFLLAVGAWGLRAVFCAAPSYWWAARSEFWRTTAKAGMVAGVLTWIVALAWITTRRSYHARIGARDPGWMIRAGASARAALAPLLTFWPDVWLGLLSIHVAQAIARFAGFGDILPQHTFTGTYVTTLIQGGLVALTMLPLGLACWCVRALWRRQRRAVVTA